MLELPSPEQGKRMYTHTVNSSFLDEVVLLSCDKHQNVTSLHLPLDSITSP